MREAPIARKASETERLAQRKSAAESIAEQAFRFALEVREQERLRVRLEEKTIAEREPFEEKKIAPLHPTFEKKAERQKQSPMPK